jgi:hypothetical protein
VSRTGNFEVYYTQKLMIELWQGIPPSGCLLDLGLVPSAPNPSLAQAPDLLTQITQVVGPGVVDRVMSIIGAVAILILGWIIATIVATVIGQLLKRTEIDNQIAAWLLGRQRSTSSEIPIEKWLTAGVFWIVMVFAILAFLDALGLQQVSGPLQGFLAEISVYAPRILSAGILAGIAWVLATIVRSLLTRGLQRFSLDDRLSQQLGDDGGSPILVNETLGNILYWFILLLFVPFILDALALQGPLAPIQALIDQVLSALPRIFKALIIGFVGWFIARFARSLLTNFLASAGADRIGARFGMGTAGGGTQSLSWLSGTAAYVIVLIVTAISVLEELQIDAISQPAIAVLDQILLAVPAILRAVLIIVIAYVVAKFVAELVTNLLTGLGFNNVLSWLGLPTTVSMAKTPSEVVGTIALVGVMLFAAIAAVESLGVPELTATLAALTTLFGQVLLGLAIFAVGLYLANLAARLIAMSGGHQAQMLAQIARIAILILVGAMSLQQMGIATDIVTLAFGLVLGALAVAAAIAFGLGGRDVASEQLRSWLNDFKSGDR